MVAVFLCGSFWGPMGLSIAGTFSRPDRVDDTLPDERASVVSQSTRSRLASFTGKVAKYAREFTRNTHQSRNIAGRKNTGKFIAKKCAASRTRAVSLPNLRCGQGAQSL